MALSPHSRVLEVVERLRGRLPGSHAPQKLLKTLKKFSALPMTLDVLLKTGVGKTVNALRKYERVAAFARGLVAQWKKLVPGTQRAPKRIRAASAQETGGRGRADGRGPKYPKLEENRRHLPRAETRARAKSRGKGERGGGRGGGGRGGGEANKMQTEDKGAARTEEGWRERGKGAREEAGTRETQKTETTGKRQPGKGETGNVGTRGNGETEVRTGGKGETGKETGRVGTRGDTKVEQKQRKRRERKGSCSHFLPLHSTSWKVYDKSHVLSQQLSMDHDRPQEKKADHLRPSQKARKRHSQAIQDKEGETAKRCLVKPEVKAAVRHHHHHSKGHKSSQKENFEVNDKGKGKNFELNKEKLVTVASREKGPSPSSRINPKEKGTVPSTSERERKTEDSSDKKKSLPPSEMAPGKSSSKLKDQDALKTKVEKSKPSVDSLLKKTQKRELTAEVKDKDKSKIQEKKTTSKIEETQELEEDEGFEHHKIPFESYLLYDQPKKRKVVKMPTTARIKEAYPKLNTIKPGIKSHSAVRKCPPGNSSQPNKSHVEASSASVQKSSFPSSSASSSVKVICHTVLPARTVHPPLSSGEHNPALQLKKQVPSAPQENRLVELPTNRVNSVITVSSGSTNSHLPKISSLYEQCIKVLGKNIDLMYEVGQVPYTILKPVLERCSPEQLYRIEEYNPIFLEDSDSLWKAHCFRDFRRELPEEFESWREMYLRLHDAQEQRLYHLTDSIRLAHARRPKGRQAKMIFISPVSRSPYDISGRQTWTVGGERTMIIKDMNNKAIQHTSSCSTSSKNDNSQVSDKKPSDRPSTSSAFSASSGGNASSAHSKKTTEKKVSPVTAKSGKTFKTRLA